MIFVTVGNGEFESLVKEIDRLVKEKKIKEEVIIQIGRGKYKPRFCQWFTFKSPLDMYFNKANLIIAHGGSGTFFDVLDRKKKLIAIPNRNHIDLQQVDFLRAMHKETAAFIYCDIINLLEQCLEQAKSHKFKRYKKPLCTINKVIEKALER